MQEKEHKKGLDLKLLGRVLGIARPFRRVLITCLVLAVVLAPISTIRPYIISRMVDDHIMNFDIQ